MRPLLLPGLLDAARHNAAHGRRRRRAVRVRPRLRARGRPRTRPRAAPTARRPPPSATTSRRCSRSRRAPGVPSRRPTSSPPRAWSRRCASAPRLELGGRAAATRPFLHPGRAARVLVRGRDRLDRRAASARRGRVGPRRRRRVRARLRRAGAARPGPRCVFADVTSLSRRAPGHRRGGCRRDAPPRRSTVPSRRPAAICSPRAASSTSTRASRWGRGTGRWRCGSSSARPTARSPTTRSPTRGPRSRPRSAGSGRKLRG